MRWPTDLPDPDLPDPEDDVTTPAPRTPDDDRRPARLGPDAPVLTDRDLDDEDPERRPRPSVSLFEGDEGGLEHAERRALVALLKQRFISARTHPRDWQALTENERVVRSRLNDLFLELQVDRVREVAWKRQAVPETGARFPTLLYDAAWSREETVVLVHLRDRFRAAAAAGEDRAYVDREDVVEHVAGFRPPHATDVAGDEKRARSAVASVNRAGLLIGAPTDDRFEISEAIESLLPLELLTGLLVSPPADQRPRPRHRPTRAFDRERTPPRRPPRGVSMRTEPRTSRRLETTRRAVDGEGLFAQRGRGALRRHAAVARRGAPAGQLGRLLGPRHGRPARRRHHDLRRLRRRARAPCSTPTPRC